MVRDIKEKEEDDARKMLKLPPGFQFSPTDEELVLHFLHPKKQQASVSPLYDHLVPDLQSHHHDPWDLHGKALWNGTQYFYFSRMMNNRTTENGYWKDLNMEEPVFGEAGEIIGIKKSLTFHTGEAPTGQETNWVMQEYHLKSFHQLVNPTQQSADMEATGHVVQVDTTSVRDIRNFKGGIHLDYICQLYTCLHVDTWLEILSIPEHGSLVLSRVYESKTSHGLSFFPGGNEDSETELSSMDEMFLLLDNDLDDVSSGD